MAIPTQKVFAGRLAERWREVLAQFAEEDFVARLWRRDASLWPAEEGEVPAIKGNLSWLSLPEELDPHIQRAVSNAAVARAAGLDHVVFVAMGGSNLACAAILDLVDEQNEWLHLIDTTDPDAILRLREKVSLSRTLFVFASKSGKRIETHALLLHFLEAMRAEGISSPGERCVALTEEGSYLTALAREYKFRDILFDPPGIFSRFCGLLHFGPALIAAGVTEKAGLLESVLEMKEVCGTATAISENPAAQLGAVLAASAEQGHRRLILFSDVELSYFAYRISQLVGLSISGKGGLQPFFGQNTEAIELLQRRCLVVILRLKGRSDDVARRVEELRDAGVPVVEIELGGAADLAAEIFKWEIATALTCAALGLNCFQSESGQGNLGPLSEELQRIVSKREPGSTGERLREDGIALYAKGSTRRLISNLSLRDALRTFFEKRDAEGYVAICPFFQLSAENLKAARQLRDRMTEALAVPVQISTGPRYLYALGKIYKHGPAKGIFIILTAEPDEDIGIPGAAYTFGELQLAFALTEWDALEGAQKPVIRAHLFDGREKGLKHFADVAIQALAQIRGISDEQR